MAKGNARHIYLDVEQDQTLDAIGVAMGKRRLGVAASRSQLIFTAVRNFIDDCMEEEDLREAIGETRKHLATGKGTPHAS
jgi:hypothetical protein